MSDDIVKALRTDAAFFGKMPPHAKVDMKPDFMREMSNLWIAAADEIERLRNERDEARREICLIRASSTNATETTSAEMDEYARSRGWECFEDVKK